MHIVVTGGAGNLGRKARALLANAPWCDTVTVIDALPADVSGKEVGVVADIVDGSDQRWITAVALADAVIHLAATDPAARSNWTHARDSFGMTANLLAHVGQERHCRFVFASSNHAMGLYKDFPIPGSGKIGMDTPPLAGTNLWGAKGYASAVAYGASKLLGERLCLATAEASGGKLSAVSLRIGWCQRDKNVARTLYGRSAGDGSQDPIRAERDVKWFRNMWLSNGDYARVMERALLAKTTTWPKLAVTIAAVSNNAETPWDLAEAKTLIGYEPEDDVWVELARDGLAQTRDKTNV